ncbi:MULTISPECIES: hypothetical protein [Pseudomonas]|uniref:Fap n=1 Tax=Pseudomonas piscis TaxID=2614538 RepID=A0ABY9N9B7_9PSED|nr:MULTISPECIES: hypothetical protein [Pseudomonas]AZC18690.1 Fap [Pseudomonas sp. CMR5c]ERO65955.1 hypothetical protein P308_16640 [Pseudomonas piscis]POA54894.1 hypothetical protein C1889_15325 [Pseudomonas sp. FW507-12TSA]WMN14965.1 hypothetical protein QL104_16460 [Pseudomonas piscis]
MGTLHKSFTRLLLIGCAISAVPNLPAMAAGNGEIILERQMYATPIGRARNLDNNPTTVNANPSGVVTGMTNGEISDNDFAGISSGALVRGAVMPNGNGVSGMNIVTNPNGLPGMSAGHGGGSGASISNSINRSMGAAMAPLNNIGGR